jgi:pre-mRNA-processing factor 39
MQQFREHLKSYRPDHVLSTEEYAKTLEELAIPPGALEDEETEKLVAGRRKTDPNRNGENEGEIRSKIYEKIISVREAVFEKTSLHARKRWHYEDGIKRPYFHVKPLESSQIKNWQVYLDYEISQDDHKSIVLLFERCLVACALYEAFWIKYLNYIQPISVDEARDVYSRACNIHLRKKYNIHLKWAAFEEERCNTTKAQEILSHNRQQPSWYGSCNDTKSWVSAAYRLS